MSQEASSDKLYEISVQEEVTARLHFIKFENAYIETCLDFIKDHLVNTETKVIKATGGGAHKFKELIERKLGLKWVLAFSLMLRGVLSGIFRMTTLEWTMILFPLL